MITNLFAELPIQGSAEAFDTLCNARGLRIERIVSCGHASPAGFWYEQPECEWVVVLRGSARLRFENEDESIEMRPGDFRCIPAGQRHRVEWTTPDVATIWLAVHFPAAPRDESNSEGTGNNS